MKDGSGVTSTATVTVTIVGAERRPDGGRRHGDRRTRTGRRSTIDVLANDTDPDANDSKTVLSVDTSETQGEGDDRARRQRRQL